MSYYLRIFCRSSTPITRKEVAEFIKEGVYFDTQPRFEPPPNAPEAQDASWDSMKVHYQEGKRPVVFFRDASNEMLEEEIEERVEAFKDGNVSNRQKKIIERLEGSNQVIAIELSPEQLSDDCWEMLDNLQVYLAGKYDGIIYAPGEGYYDADLQPLYEEEAT
jgi:hypothetical protein